MTKQELFYAHREAEEALLSLCRAVPGYDDPEIIEARNRVDALYDQWQSATDFPS